MIVNLNIFIFANSFHNNGRNLINERSKCTEFVTLSVEHPRLRDAQSKQEHTFSSLIKNRTGFIVKDRTVTQLIVRLEFHIIKGYTFCNTYGVVLAVSVRKVANH